MSLTPSIMTNSFTTPSKQKTTTIRRKKEKPASSPAVPDEQQIIEVEPDPAVEDALHPPSTPNYYNKPNSLETPRTEDPLHRKRSSKRHKLPKSSTIPLTSDARAEHLLLAARKIGRQRVEMLASTKPAGMNAPEDERRDSWASLPKTPKRPPARLAPHIVAPIVDPTHTPHGLNHFVFYSDPTRSSSSFSGSPVHAQFLIPVTGYPPMQTPAHRPSLDRIRASTPETTPQTPLDSLLSAARSMMNSGSTPRANGVGSSAPAESTGKTRRSGVVEMPESPVPSKRRKIPGSSVRGNSGLVRRTQSQTKLDLDPETPDGREGWRVKSALDVLADQAAVFSSNERSVKGKERTSGPRRKSPELEQASPSTSRMKRARKRKVGRGENESDLGTTMERETGIQKPQISSPNTSERGASMDGGRWRVVHKPPDGHRSGGSAGPSSIPMTLWEREDTSHAETSNSRAQPVGVRSQQDDWDDDRNMPPISPLESLPSLNTPSRPRARTPLQPLADYEGSDDDDDDGGRTPRSRPQKQLPATAVILEQARSEESREHEQSDVESLRATPVPPGAIHHDAGQDIHSESGAQRRSPDEDTVEPSSNNVVDLYPVDPEAKELALGTAEVEQSPGHNAVDRNLEKVAGQEIQLLMPGKRPRSPYVKWSREEDELLAQVSGPSAGSN